MTQHEGRPFGTFFGSKYWKKKKKSCMLADFWLELGLRGRLPLHNYGNHWFSTLGFSLILHLIAQLATLSITACLSSVMATYLLCTGCCGTIRRKLASTFPVTGKTSEILWRELLMGSEYFELYSNAFTVTTEKNMVAEKVLPLDTFLSYWHLITGCMSKIFLACFAASLLYKCIFVCQSL